MKKLLFLLLLLFVSILNAEWVDIAENSEQKLFGHSSLGKEYTEVNFTLNGYNVETIRADETDYQKISYLNEGNSLEVGKPDLPKFTRLISIPDEGFVSFEIINTEYEIVNDINVYPAQELQSESDKIPFEFVIDEDYYTSGPAFPSNIVEIGEPIILRDQRVVSVSVNPFQYDPKDKTLRIIKNVDIVVNASDRGGINPKTSDKKKSRFFEPLYRSSILNYDSVTERDGEYQDPSYLFIYPNDATLLSNLEYLTDWKHQKGFNVALASTAVTGTSTTTIKNYIQNAYDTWEDPPEFVCFVGDVGGTYSIPTYYASGGEGDHPYAQLEGGDVLEDVFLGRISIASITNLQTYIAKVLGYEKEPYMLETDWYNNSLMVGDPSSSGPSTIFTKQFIIEMMQQHAPNITATEIFYGNCASVMVSNLNSGVSYFNYRGYMNMSGFGNTHISSLTNYKKLPFAVFLTCATGNFASEASCRSETFIRAGSAGNPTGAIAAIGTATTGTHTNFNNCVDAGIFYGIFADGIYNPGGAVNRGKIALYEHYPQNPGGYVDIFSHWNTLIGDPGVELWTGIPQDLVADYETDISPGTNYLEVTVTNDNGIPLENAWVTALMGDDEIFVTGYTDENGYIALEINANAEGTANLTVTKHNYIPHLGGFDVGLVDRFVNVFDVLIDDDNFGTSAGNGDEQINPGEDIELQVSLKNFGTQSAESVTATITTDNDFITITDAVEDFGSIPSGNAVFSTDDFDISIAEDVLGGTEITLAIEIEDNIGNTWNDIIFLVVEGANLDVTDYTIEDGNGYLDPGETVEMNVTLQNLGSVTANAVYGELISPDNRVTVSDADGYFGTIAGAGGQASNTSDTFEVTAGAQLIVGTQIMMELHLYNAEGYDSIVYFILGIGEVSITDPVGPDAYGYFCYDDGDTDYLSAPIYDWVEINSIGTNLNLYDPGDDGDSATINNLPITFRMYGEEYDSATVCSNGWIAPGGSTQGSFMNSPIPGPQGPSPMIAPFWDDLKTGSGGVYWYYDSSLHTVIIEWDHMQNDYNNAEETFQAILYDANYYPTTTGDSEIKFQYKVINNTNPGSYPSQHGQYSTVGIEDPSGTIGLEYTFNNTYPIAAKHLQNELALRITGPSIPLEQPFLVFGGVTIIDENGNGQADYGEDVSLDVLLNNLGENPATGVSATISSADVYITINQATSIYNNVPGGGSASSQTDFEITVAEDCPDGHIVNFEMNITSNENSWVLYFTIELNAPIIEFETLFIDDGDNNILDPGETADIYVFFLNEGGADAYNVLTELTESDPYVILNSTTYNFGTFNAGSVMTAIYNVSVTSTAPIGHVTDVSVEINADLNYYSSTEFELQIGFAFSNEGFESGDFESLDWVMGGSADWVISTDAIEGVYSAKSGIITHNQNSDLQITMDVLSDGVISFYRKVSSESNYDYLEFYINGVLQNEWAGTVGWSQVTYSVLEGTRTFKWSYDKDGSVSTGSDCAWIDDIVFPAGGAISDIGFLEGNVTLESGAGDLENVNIYTGNNLTHPDANGDYILPLPAGTYDVIASLEGYETVTEYDVQIIAYQTEIINFELTYLQAPEDLVASVISNDVTLEWNMTTMRIAGTRKEELKMSKASSENRVEFEESNSTQTTSRSLTGFKVYRNNFEITHIINITQFSYSDSGLDSGDYSYYVTAIYDDYNESLPSNTAEITVVLDPPTDLTAEPQEPDIVLNWNAPSAERSLTGYRVYCNGSPIADVIETTYTDGSLHVGIYTYFVTGLYGEYESAATNEVTIELTEADDPLPPSHTALIGNYPNPFNPETTISFSTLESSVSTTISIYNIKGQMVRELLNTKLSSGFHTIVWDGKSETGKPVTSGIYFYEMQNADYTKTKKMILLK